MSDSLFSVLILLDDNTLLLPNSAIAEVTSLDWFAEPEADSSPSWLAGWHASAERRIPVVSFEAMASGRQPAPGRRARIVILHTIGQKVGGGSFAILAQGQPQLVTVEADNIEPLSLLPTDDGALVLSRVRVNDQDAIIPDIQQIESRLASLA